jgi:hypothetical protein
LAVLFLYSRDKWLSKAAALSFGLFLPLVVFVLKLAYDGTLNDYYLQTVAIQDRIYFGDKGPLLGLRQVFEVFATGYGPEGLPHLKVGFAPFGSLFGALWFCIFAVNAFVVIQFGIRLLSGASDKARIHEDLPPSVLSVAMLTCIGPLFAIHNAWDNFRYALHIAQGIGVIFYCINRIAGRANAQPVILTLAFFFFAPLYSVVETTRDSITYLLARAGNHAQVSYAKYFEGIDLAPVFRDRLIFAQKFLDLYYTKYPDSYVYTAMWAITDGIYAIGKFPVYDKTLTNDHFAAIFPLYYPEFASKFDAAARSRKLIFLTVNSEYAALKAYDYVKFREVNGLSIFIARERAESFSMP